LIDIGFRLRFHWYWKFYSGRFLRTLDDLRGSILRQSTCIKSICTFLCVQEQNFLFSNYRYLLPVS